MKFNHKHFKSEIKVRRWAKSVWEKYYDLKKKKELTEFDKFWIKQLRQQNKINQFKLILTHIPTKTKFEKLFKLETLPKPLLKKAFFDTLIGQIQSKRKTFKEIKGVTKVFEGAKYHLIGNVFPTPGQINPMSQYLTINDPMAHKTPRKKDNYIGIELEFNMLDRANSSQEQKNIANSLKAAGLARYVDVTTDSSCGWEVRVLLLESEFETHLTKILDVLNGMGFQTNDRCGTHVHFDMRNRDVKVVYDNLFKTQKFLRKFLTKGRKYNNYCKMNKATTFKDQLDLGDRYFGINVEAYRRHKTLEVRMHQGTLKAEELIPWIHLLTKIVNYKSSLEKSVNTLKQAKEQFKIDIELVQDLEERIMTVFSKKKITASTFVAGGATFASVIANLTGAS